MLNFRALNLGCEYQPFIDPRTLSTWGYEALARFRDEQGQIIAPNLVFEQLHQTTPLLTRVELEAKRLQLAHADRDYPLFLNLDPHSIDQTNISTLIELVHQFPRVTLELIENTCVSDATRAIALAKTFRAHKLAVALDDIGAPDAILSLELMAQVDYLKFDRHWLNPALTEQERLLLTSLIAFGRSTNKLTILEGIETQSQLAFAMDSGVDLVQGFLFRDRFIQSPCFIPLHLE